MALRIVQRAGIVTLAGGLVAASASAQDFTYTTGQFTLDVGTAAFRVPVEASVVKGAPFSADIVTESVQPLADGNRIVHRSTTRFYRDSAGRVRREEDRGGGSPVISIADPVAGTSFLLDPDTRTAVQTPRMMSVHTTGELQKLRVMSHGPVAIGRGSFEFAPAAENLRTEQLPARTLEGVRVEGVRRTTTIAAGAIGNELPIGIVSEEWTSPDLKVLVLTEHSDPRMGTSTYRLTNINRVEPDAYLFEVPADYTVRTSPMISKPLRVRPE